MSTTKITTSSVRVMLSHNYSSFEATMTLENPDGIESSEIKNALNQCQVIASEAVADYKVQLKGVLVNPVKEIAKIEKTVKDLKTAIKTELQPVEDVEQVDPDEVARIASLPAYTPKQKAEPKAKRSYTKKSK